ncbi:MAG TPA: hypothetical protein VF808_16035 [Ktedonobacterales bacterium]
MDGPEHADSGDELELRVSDVRTGAPSSAVPPAGSPVAPRRRLPRHMGTVVVLVALVIIVAASPELRASGLALLLGPQATPTATLVRAHPTPVPGPRVRWQPSAALPDQLTLGSSNVSGAVAPSDGRIAYLCDASPPPQGTPTPAGETSRFWVTHDRVAHWTPALAISAQSNPTTCDAEIDALDPSLVVLASSHEDLSAASAAPGPVDSLPDQTVNEVTFDGGATWRRLAGNQQLFGLTTVKSVTFALRATQPGQGASAPMTFDLAMSRDQMRTWTPIDGAIRAVSPQEQVLDYTLDPTTGALLVAASDMNGQSSRLWSSADTGQHWRELPMPAGGGTGFMQLWLPHPPGAAPKRICGTPMSSASGTSDASGASVVCSAAGGATWTHPIAFPYADQYSPGRLAPDGALLITGSGTDAQGNPIGGAALYRLPAGATRWQTLGPVPEPGVFCVAGPGGGILWALPVNSPGSDAQGRIFTAVYP